MDLATVAVGGSAGSFGVHPFFLLRYFSGAAERFVLFCFRSSATHSVLISGDDLPVNSGAVAGGSVQRMTSNLLTSMTLNGRRAYAFKETDRPAGAKR